ncbi:MAG: hypothetical protein ACRDHZ_24730, partial [Ktedonobacteraceae bacterium]
LIPRSNTWPSHVGNNNSNGNFTKLENGIFTDRVGLNVKPPAGTNFDAISDQTFTIRYQGETYPVSTEFEHETKVVTDPVTNNVTVTNSVMVEVP